MQNTFDLETVVTYAVSAFKQNGESYNNFGGQTSNKNIILSHLGLLDDSRASFVDQVTELDAETARHLIQYYKGLTFKAMGNKINDFEQRVLDFIQKGVVDRRDIGVVASLPKSFFRAVERDKSDAELRKLSLSSEFIGSEGEEVCGTIKILNCSFIQKLQCHIVNACMGENIVVFFTKHPAEHWGESCEIKGRVKRHQNSRFHNGKETVLNYVKTVDKV